MILRLAAGCVIVSRHRSEALASWVAAGRRGDLTGWRAALGPAARLILLVGGGYVTFMLLWTSPWIMWLVAGASLRAAWRSGRRPANAVPRGSREPLVDTSDEPLAGPPAEAAVAHLRRVLGDRDRVHLSEVLADLQKGGHGEGWTVADLRARLESLGIPTHRKVKVGKTPTRGVYRADLDAHFPTQKTAPSPIQVDAA
ncbi:hypothetical protein [Streptomyces sp. NPDC094049]|uniref:hypothetical protein n=1 Tax=Streptomyces sp. NPDC094049 TaxID=3154987 RepID=UPI003321B2E0